MNAVHVDDTGAPADIAELAASARVVIFRSGLTDTRHLVRYLERASVDFREITMGMGSSAERDRFHRLREWTGWTLLPQVFLDGAFVGGADELIARAAFGPPDALGRPGDPC